MTKKTLLSIFFLLGISASIKAQNRNPFGKPLVPDMIADASIQQINGTFYCYATTDGYGKGLKSSGPPVLWKSKDFVNWSFEGTYFPSAAKELYWAPSKAVPANGKFYIYPTVNGHMYPAVAGRPEGPFKLARGKDEWFKPYTPSTLLQTKKPNGIDAEIFIDDDKQAYVFWNTRHAAKLMPDMITVDSAIQVISTQRTQYSEGPIFFKRKGIYYYLYTIGGNEKYQYAYIMSKVSPLGPYTFPKNDIISTTNNERGLFGPGHGSVFNLEGTDIYYFAFLEFGRGSTNRQTYVSPLTFASDGSINPVDVSLDGVGELAKIKHRKPLQISNAFVSSTADSMKIKPISDPSLKREEFFDAEFAFDGSNGSRWMAKESDTTSWITADLGKVKSVSSSEVYFVRPAAGHAYLLETSTDGKSWKKSGGHSDTKVQSPHVDQLALKCRYLRIKILNGEAGIWEWHLY